MQPASIAEDVTEDQEREREVVSPLKTPPPKPAPLVMPSVPDVPTAVPPPTQLTGTGAQRPLYILEGRGCMCMYVCVCVHISRNAAMSITVPSHCPFNYHWKRGKPRNRRLSKSQLLTTLSTL